MILKVSARFLCIDKRLITWRSSDKKWRRYFKVFSTEKIMDRETHHWWVISHINRSTRRGLTWSVTRCLVKHPPLPLRGWGLGTHKANIFGGHFWLIKIILSIWHEATINYESLFSDDTETHMYMIESNSTKNFYCIYQKEAKTIYFQWNSRESVGFLR